MHVHAMYLGTMYACLYGTGNMITMLMLFNTIKHNNTFATTAFNPFRTTVFPRLEDKPSTKSCATLLAIRIPHHLHDCRRKHLLIEVQRTQSGTAACQDSLTEVVDVLSICAAPRLKRHLHLAAEQPQWHEQRRTVSEHCTSENFIALAQLL